MISAMCFSKGYLKIQNIFLQFILAFPMMLILGCAQPSESVVTPSTSTPILPTGSVDPAISFTPTRTELPTATTTPVLIPTLPFETARTELLKLLATNGDCQLPCLWGIVPMESPFQEARTILAPLSGLSFSGHLDPPGPGSLTPRYTEGDLEIYTSITFLTNPDDNIVNRIVFYAEAHRPLPEGGYEDIYDSIFFGEKVSAYSLSHVLSEHGVPTSVMIATFGGPLTRGGTGGFDVLLLYPNQGILINYTTQMHVIGSNVRGCLTNAHIEMQLFPPGNVDTFSALLETTDWAIKKNAYELLEETTSMSVNEFYEIFRELTSTCIETPADLWPIPEP